MLSNNAGSVRECLFFTLKWHLAPFLPLHCFIPNVSRPSLCAVQHCCIFSCYIYFILLAASLLYPFEAAGAEFCMQMVTLVIFLPSLHSIVWGKEEMCSEEVNRAGKEWSVLVEDSTWSAEMSLQSLIGCSD